MDIKYASPMNCCRTLLGKTLSSTRSVFYFIGTIPMIKKEGCNHLEPATPLLRNVSFKNFHYIYLTQIFGIIYKICRCYEQSINRYVSVAFLQKRFQLFQ